MARYKPVHPGLKLLLVDFDQQVIPGSFEHALCYIVDHELDLAEFHARYNNDDEGAPAFDPAALIKIILLAYSRGIISSRKMERACLENVLFMAVSGDSHPHFTTLAAFVSEMGDSVASLFAQGLLVCDRQGLIGRETFAIDGVKLPSNASKQKSGTRADYQRQLDKMEAATHKMIAQQQHAIRPPLTTRSSSASRSGWNACTRKLVNYATGSRHTPKIVKVPKVPCVCRTAPTTARQDGHQQGRDPRVYRCGRG